MSVVAARNVGREDIKDEGMSHLFGTSQTLKDLLDTHPDACPGGSPGVLVKLIDSAERLTLQVHPDREKAMELFHSPYGKTECWHILGTRDVDGQTPCIYLGFRPGITREYWKHLFDTQDIPGMLDAMQKFEVKPGDTILIEGGMPHAIGAGCLLAEIQEPTDITLRAERIRPDGSELPPESLHSGAGMDALLDCFDFSWALPAGTVRERCFLRPEARMLPGGEAQVLVGPEKTPYFGLVRLVCTGRCRRRNDPFRVLLVERGCGWLEGGGERLPLRQGTEVFVPHGVKEYALVPQGELAVLECVPPRPEQ